MDNVIIHDNIFNVRFVNAVSVAGVMTGCRVVVAAQGRTNQSF